jgi:hypothetical protein
MSPLSDTWQTVRWWCLRPSTAIGAEVPATPGAISPEMRARRNDAASRKRDHNPDPYDARNTGRAEHNRRG